MECGQLMKREVHVVADASGRVVGVLTDRDLAIRVCAEDAPAVTRRVGDVMTSGAVSCWVTQSITHAERLMRRHHLTRVVVVDENSRPVGIVSLSDVAQYDAPARVGRTLRAVAERKYAPERP